MFENATYLMQFQKCMFSSLYIIISFLNVLSIRWYIAYMWKHYFDWDIRVNMINLCVMNVYLCVLYYIIHIYDVIIFRINKLWIYKEIECDCC